MNLTSNDIADLRRQGITVDEDDTSPKTIPVPETITLPQMEEDTSWISDGIICPMQSKSLRNKNAAFKNYSHEEVLKMTNLELFFVITTVDYQKEILFLPQKNLKDTMDLG